MGERMRELPKAPFRVATTTLFVTALPLLISLLLSGSYVWKFISGSDITTAQLTGNLLIFIAGMAGSLTYVLLLARAMTVREAWSLSIATVVLLLGCTAPPVLSIGAGFMDEWCESQPGGRGWSGPVGLEDIPKSYQ
jgi:hypothetical protein